MSPRPERQPPLPCRRSVLIGGCKMGANIHKRIAIGSIALLLFVKGMVVLMFRCLANFWPVRAILTKGSPHAAQWSIYPGKSVPHSRCEMVARRWSGGSRRRFGENRIGCGSRSLLDGHGLFRADNPQPLTNAPKSASHAIPKRPARFRVRQLPDGFLYTSQAMFGDGFPGAPLGFGEVMGLGLYGIHMPLYFQRVFLQSLESFPQVRHLLQECGDGGLLLIGRFFQSVRAHPAHHLHHGVPGEFPSFRF